MPALVLNATEDVGEGVVGALLDSGRPVVAVGREASALATLRKRLNTPAHLQLMTGHTDDDDSAARLTAAVSRLKRPPGAVVDVVTGLPRPGRLLDTSIDGLRARFDVELAPHMIAARHLLATLTASGRPGTYLVVGGPAADQPWAGYGCQSLAAATLRALIRVLDEETRQTPIRVRQLAVDTPIRTERNRQHASIDWPNCHEVGHRVADILKNPTGQTVLHLQRRCRPDPLSTLRHIAQPRTSP